MNNKVVFLSVMLLSACSSKNPYYEKLYGSWTCNGKGISLAADTYHRNGKFTRYLRENGQVMFQEGTFSLDDDFLRIKVDRQAFRTNSVTATKSSVLIQYHYKIKRLSASMLDFRRFRSSVGPRSKRKLQTCRKVYEQRAGFFYASARIGRLKKESNKFTKIESPVTAAIRDYSADIISQKNVAIAIKINKIHDSPSIIKSKPVESSQGYITQNKVSSNKDLSNGKEETKSLKPKTAAAPKEKLEKKGGVLVAEKSEVNDTKNTPAKNSVPIKLHGDQNVPLITKNTSASEVSGEEIKKPFNTDSSKGTEIVLTGKSPDRANTDAVLDSKNIKMGVKLATNKRIILNSKRVIITINRPAKGKPLEQKQKPIKKLFASVNPKSAVIPYYESVIKINSKKITRIAKLEIPPKINQLMRQQKYLTRQIKILDALQRDRNRAYDTLRALSQALVPHLKLDSVRQKDNRFTLSGQASERSAISMFVKKLSHSPHLKKVSTGKIYTTEKGETFTLSFQQAHSVSSYQYLQVRRAVTQQNKAGAKRRVRELKAVRDSLLKRFPNKDEVQLLVRKLKWKAKKVGLKVIRFERLQGIKKENYYLVRVRIEAVGDYDSVIVFLNRLGRRKHVNRVRGLQLRVQDDSRNGAQTVSLYVSMTLDLIRMSSKLQRERSRVPNLKFRFVELTPYNRVPYSDDEGVQNPFRVITGRFVEYCNGPLNKAQVNKVKLVAILNKRKHMALLKTLDGKIYRARYGTCISRNTRISRITHKSVVLRTVKVKYGRPTVIVRHITLEKN